jgi:DNA-binding LytR/AlgR family response regulator
MKTPPLFYRSDGILVKINPQDILYIISADNYCKFHTFNEVLTIRISLESAVKQLPPGMFVQVHRSFAVPVNYIDGIARDYLIVHTGGMKQPVQVQVSKKYYGALVKKIKIMGPVLQQPKSTSSKKEELSALGYSPRKRIVQLLKEKGLPLSR